MEEKKKYLSGYRLASMRIRRLGELIEDFPELSGRFAEKLQENIAVRERIEQQIDAVDGGVLSELLSQKYISGKSLEEIGFCMNYSKRHIERLHLKALKKFSMS